MFYDISIIPPLLYTRIPVVKSEIRHTSNKKCR